MKRHISLVDSYARIGQLDFEAYNESAYFWKAVYRYLDRYDRWPERILADKIYRNRQTLFFCKEHGIRLSGPALGKPPKDRNQTRQLKNQEYHNSCGRNAVEGTFGTSKTSYRLDRISVRLMKTTCCMRSLRSLLLFPPTHLPSLAVSPHLRLQL